MGAGATLHSPTDGLALLRHGSGRHFFCHACSRSMSYSGDDHNMGLLCPYCGSSFLEEQDVQQQQERQHLQQRRRDLQDLSSEQSRRLANAATMLQLLEQQLHGEMASLHGAVVRRDEQQQLQEGGSEPSACLSPLMRKKLRKAKMDTDTVCSQPSCPICSEDFEVGGVQLCMPCSHFYHEACVLPWLDAKRTCPICRFELTNAVPSADDLDKFSVAELREKYDQEVTEEREAHAAAQKKEQNRKGVAGTDDDADGDRGSGSFSDSKKGEEEEEEDTSPPLFLAPEGYTEPHTREAAADRPLSGRFRRAGEADKAALCKEINALMARRKEQLDLERSVQAMPASAGGISAQLMRQILTGASSGGGGSGALGLGDSDSDERGGFPRVGRGLDDVIARAGLGQAREPSLEDLLRASSSSGGGGGDEGQQMVQLRDAPSLREMLGEGSFRTAAERRANPSASNRTLREVINDGEQEEEQQLQQRREGAAAFTIDARASMIRRIREEEAARQRIMQRVAETNAEFGESHGSGIIPVSSSQLEAQNNLVNNLTAMQQVHARSGAQGVITRGDGDDDDENDESHGPGRTFSREAFSGWLRQQAQNSDSGGELSRLSQLSQLSQLSGGGGFTSSGDSGSGSNTLNSMNAPMMLSLSGVPRGLLPASMLRGGGGGAAEGGALGALGLGGLDAAQRGPFGGSSTGRVIEMPGGTLRMPQTFVVRSSGGGVDGPTATERRAALREAMGLVPPPSSS